MITHPYQYQRDSEKAYIMDCGVKQMKKSVTAALLLSLSLGITGTAFAADADVSDQEYKDMQARVAVLRAKVATLKQDNTKIEKKVEKEDKVGNALKLSGDMRAKFIDQHIGKHTQNTQTAHIEARYNVGRDLMFGANLQLMDGNSFGNTARDTAGLVDFSSGNQRYGDFSGADRLHFSHLWMRQSHLFGENDRMTIKIGRMGHDLGGSKYWSQDDGGWFDGVRLGFGHDDNFMIAYGKWNADPTYDKYWNNMSSSWDTKHKKLEKCYVAQAWTRIDGWKLFAWMVNSQNDDATGNYKMRGVGFYKPWGKYTFYGDYSKNLARSADGMKPSGLFLRVKYGKAQYNTPGTWAVGLDYMRIEPNNIFDSGLNGVNDVSFGLKDNIGLNTFVLWGEYTLSRNLRVAVYQSIGRRAMRDYSDKNYGTWMHGDSAPAYSRIHFVWNF